MDDLREAYKDHIQHTREEASRLGPAIPSSSSPISDGKDGTSRDSTSDIQATNNDNKSTPSFHTYKPPRGLKTLSSYLDVSKTRALPHKEIEAVWRLRHAHDEQSLVATLSAERYARMATTARRYPRFVLPIPRTVDDDQNDGNGNDNGNSSKRQGSSMQGQKTEQTSSRHEAAPAPEAVGTAAVAADVHFLEWTFPAPHTTVLLFTSLAEYKLRREYAVPHTTVTMHLELAAAAGDEPAGSGAGPVLLHANVLKDRGVSVQDARWLLLCAQRFYHGSAHAGNAKYGNNSNSSATSGSKEKGEIDELELLDMFSRGDVRFEIGQVLERVQRLG